MEFKVSPSQNTTLTMQNANGLQFVFDQIPPILKFTYLILIVALSAPGCSKLVSHPPQAFDSSQSRHSQSRSKGAARAENRSQPDQPHSLNSIASQEAMRTRYDQIMPGAIKVPSRQPLRLEPINKIQFPGDSAATVVQVSDQQNPHAANPVRHSFLSDSSSNNSEATIPDSRNTATNITDGLSRQSTPLLTDDPTQVEQPLSRPSKSKLANANHKPNTLLLRTTNDLERATSAVHPPVEASQNILPDHRATENEHATESSRRKIKDNLDAIDQTLQSVESVKAEFETDVETEGNSAIGSNMITETISMGERLMLLALPNPASTRSVRLNNYHESTETQQKNQTDSMNLQAAGIVVDREAFEFSSERPIPPRSESPAATQFSELTNASTASSTPTKTFSGLNAASGPQVEIEGAQASSGSSTGFTLEAIPRDMPGHGGAPGRNPSQDNPHTDEQYFSPNRFIPKGEVPRLQQPPADEQQLNYSPADNPATENWRWGMPPQWFPAIDELLNKTTSLFINSAFNPRLSRSRVDSRVAQVGYWEPQLDSGHPTVLTRIPKSTTPSLSLINGQFCSDIRGFRKLTPIVNRQFQPGQTVLVYCEVQNFNSELTQHENGLLHVTRLTSVCSIVDHTGNVVDQYRFPEIYDESPEQRDNFYVYFPIRFRSLEPGEYSMEIAIQEGIHGKAGAVPSRDPALPSQHARLDQNLPFTITKEN